MVRGSGSKPDSFWNIDVSKATTLFGQACQLSRPSRTSALQAVSSVEEARLMKAAGADAIWVKREALQPAKGEGVGRDWAQALLIDLADAMTGDD